MNELLFNFPIPSPRPLTRITPPRKRRNAPACAACVCIITDNLVASYFQGEAIHPDCAIISQHLRAREICSQTRRSEAQNQTEQSGGFVSLCVMLLCCFLTQTLTWRDHQERSRVSGAGCEDFKGCMCRLHDKKEFGDVGPN